jgi:hypothetical protein
MLMITAHAQGSRRYQRNDLYRHKRSCANSITSGDLGVVGLETFLEGAWRLSLDCCCLYRVCFQKNLRDDYPKVGREYKWWCET